MEEVPHGVEGGNTTLEDASDALNDETFGDTGPLNDSWEERHRQFVEEEEKPPLPVVIGAEEEREADKYNDETFGKGATTENWQQHHEAMAKQQQHEGSGEPGTEERDPPASSFGRSWWPALGDQLADRVQADLRLGYEANAGPGHPDPLQTQAHTPVPRQMPSLQSPQGPPPLIPFSFPGPLPPGPGLLLHMPVPPGSFPVPSMPRFWGPGPGGMPVMQPPWAPVPAPPAHFPPIHPTRLQQAGMQADLPAADSVWDAPRRALRRSMMSTDEISYIIHQQLKQVQVNNPYVDNYYYQAFFEKRDETRRILSQNDQSTLRASIGERTPQKKPFEGLAFEGALGRVAPQNIRTPKPLLQLQRSREALDESDESNSEEEDMTGTQEEVGLFRCARSSIERMMDILSDIHDMERAIRASEANLESEGCGFEEERAILIATLYNALRVYTPPEDDAEAAADCLSGASKCKYNEDTFFMYLSLLPKGKKLLVRSLPLFDTQQHEAVMDVFFRNLLFFAAASPSLEEHVRCETDFLRVLEGVMSRFELASIVSCLYSLLRCHSKAQLRKAVKTLIGAGLLMILFRRANVLVTAELQDPVKVTPDSPAQYWVALFDMLFESLKGQFAAIVGAMREQRWPFAEAVARCASLEQRHILKSELGELAASHTDSAVVKSFISICSSA